MSIFSGRQVVGDDDDDNDKVDSVNKIMFHALDLNLMYFMLRCTVTMTFQ